MSTSLELVSLRESQLENLWQHPDNVWNFVCGGDPDNCPTADFCLEDAWHVLIKLITDDSLCRRYRSGVPAPFNLRYVFEGELMDAANCDFCHCLYPEDVDYAAQALSNFDQAALHERYCSSLFTELDEDDIYRKNYWCDPENFPLLAAYCKKLVDFFTAAAQRGDAVIYYTK